MNSDKVTFLHDSVSDNLYDAKGAIILTNFSSMNYKPLDNEEGEKFDKVKKLIGLGVKPEEIIDMKKAGVL